MTETYDMSDDVGMSLTSRVSPAQVPVHRGALYYGDNLQVLRDYVKDESVDLVYLDPPFNSKRAYNVLFKEADAAESEAQVQAFDDYWKWDAAAERAYEQLTAPLTRGRGAPERMIIMLEALRKFLGDGNMIAYLVMMGARLVELHRVLKPTGSLYLHCDPTASHYLKLLLDAVFGTENFRSELIWKRSSAHGGTRKWGPIHDSLLMYTRSDAYTWNPQMLPEAAENVGKWYVHEDRRGVYKRGDLTGAGVRSGASGQPWRGFNPTPKGRHWAVPREIIAKVAASPTDLSPQAALDFLFDDERIIWPKKIGGQPMLKRYLHEAKGVPAGDIITDIPPLSLSTTERLGYPTQKPLALLDRIIAASSNAGDTVLDPFCGSGTAIESAGKLGRSWIGIDITYLAIPIIRKRLKSIPGASYKIHGVPADLGNTFLRKRL